MKTIAKILIITTFAVIPFAFAASVQACERCDWEYSGAEHCAMFGHDWYESDEYEAGCDYDGWKLFKCYECNSSYHQTIPATGHSWSDPRWVWDPWNEWDFSDLSYGCYCEKCNRFDYDPITVRKGKYKQVLPKRFTRNAKKIKVSYNKKKLSVTKRGKVKGKKRGSSAYVTWQVKYRGYSGWMYYTAKVRVK